MQEPDGTIVICEVKTRSRDAVSRPAEAVNAAKQKRLILAAQYYLQQNGLSDAPVRFDVAEVFPLDSGRWEMYGQGTLPAAAAGTQFWRSTAKKERKLCSFSVPETTAAE